MSATGDVALEWVRRGWRVFPLAPRSKEPLAGSHGSKDASDSVKQVSGWFAGKRGDRNVGGVPPQNHVVIDIDPRSKGDHTLAELEAEHGEMPPTWTHVTGRGDGGRHLLYRLPDGVTAKQVRKPGPGIDVKAGPGGYVVLPPSVHPDTGQPYVLVEGGAKIAELPAWMVAAPQSRTAPKPRPARTGGTDRIGQFNEANTWSDVLDPHGWTLVKGDGETPGSEWRHPTATTSKSASIGPDGRLYVYSGNTPLPEHGQDGEANGHDRFDAHVWLNFGGNRSAALASLRSSTNSKQPGSGRRRLTVMPASAVEAKVVEWWEDCWIPRAAITLIAGREGLGKSTVAAEFAARETRNGGVVLYLDSEDSRAHTIRPRLEAAGADLGRVYFLNVTEDTGGGQEFGTTLSLPADFDLLRQTVEELGVTFVILDAASSFIDPELKSNQDRDIRRFLEPFRTLAEDFNLVVAGIVHFGKRDSTDSGKLILGSIAWSQVARSVLAVAHKADTDELIITNAKGNLAPRKRSEKLALVSRSVTIGDETTTVGGIEWRGPSDVSATDLLGEQDKKLEDYGDGVNQVVRALVEFGPSKPKALADRLNQDSKKVSSWLGRAMDYGLAQRTDTNGTWKALVGLPAATEADAGETT